MERRSRRGSKTNGAGWAGAVSAKDAEQIKVKYTRDFSLIMLNDSVAFAATALFACTRARHAAGHRPFTRPARAPDSDQTSPRSSLFCLLLVSSAIRIDVERPWIPRTPSPRPRILLSRVSQAERAAPLDIGGENGADCFLGDCPEQLED